MLKRVDTLFQVTFFVPLNISNAIYHDLILALLNCRYWMLRICVFLPCVASSQLCNQNGINTWYCWMKYKLRSKEKGNFIDFSKWSLFNLRFPLSAVAIIDVAYISLRSFACTTTWIFVEWGGGQNSQWKTHIIFICYDYNITNIVVERRRIFPQYHKMLGTIICQ